MSKTPSIKEFHSDLKVTQCQENILLSDLDRDLLMSVLDNPPELNDKLRSALERYRNKYDL